MAWKAAEMSWTWTSGGEGDADQVEQAAVQPDHLVAGLGQPGDEHGPDVALGPGHQHAHVKPSPRLIRSTT
jgi:hypothetical protein